MIVTGAALIILFGVARLLHALRDRVGFLRGPRTRAALTALVGGLGAAAASAASGGAVDLSAVGQTLIGVVVIYLRAEPLLPPAENGRETAP